MIPGRPGPLRSKVHLSDELSVPAHKRVRCHDHCDTFESLPVENLCLSREAATLLVIQAQGSALHLLLEHAVLIDEVLDQLGLVATDPPRENEEERPEWMEHGHWRDILGHRIPLLDRGL